MHECVNWIWRWDSGYRNGSKFLTRSMLVLQCKSGGRLATPNRRVVGIHVDVTYMILLTMSGLPAC